MCIAMHKGWEEGGTEQCTREERGTGATSLSINDRADVKNPEHCILATKGLL